MLHTREHQVDAYGLSLSFGGGTNYVSTENEAITYNADIGLVFSWVLGVLGIVKCSFGIFDCCIDHRNRSFHTWLLFFLLQSFSKSLVNSFEFCFFLLRSLSKSLDNSFEFLLNRLSLSCSAFCFLLADF